MAHDVNQSGRNIAAQVRSALVNRISAERFELWIPPDTAWDFQQGILKLVFQSDFACNLCRKVLRQEIASALSEVVGAIDQEIHFVVCSNPQMIPSKSEVNSTDSGQPGATSSADSASAVGVRQPAKSQLEIADVIAPTSLVQPDSQSEHAGASSPIVNDNHADNIKTTSARNIKTNPPVATNGSLWSSVVTGDSNQLAWTTANLVISEPGRLTPVMMHGPTGTGKSLILAALAQRMRSDLRMRRVVHMTSEQFTNDFTEGLRGGGLPMFRRKYRDVDALLLDDIHFFAGKRSTLAEVRHTVDNLLRSGKQVVTTADRPLGELSGLGDELIGRLRGGLVTPLFPLDEKIRLNLLKHLASAAAIDIDGSILEQLAARVGGDGRLIRGVVHRLTAVASMHHGKLPWEQCWSAVMDLVQATAPVVRMVDIERVVCGIFGLEPESLQSTSKMRSVSQPRMLAMFLARKYTPAAYKEIGDYFGKRRHSTVISAEKTVASWLSENAKLEGNQKLNVRDAIRYVEAQLQVG